jgi:16S rRNA processing protein RimM
VEPLTDWPSRFNAGSRLLLERAPFEHVEVTVESGGPHKGRFLVTFEGTEGREAAEALRGLYLMIRESDASQLGEGEFWAHELVGLKLVREGGDVLGEVREVLCREAQDLLVIERDDRSEFSVPFVEEFVKEVDMEGGTITVELAEGMEQ